jgi:hypothetical protein
MVSAPVFSALIGMCFLGLSSGSASLVLAFFVPATCFVKNYIVINASYYCCCCWRFVCVCLLAKTPTGDVACVLNSYHQQTNHSVCVLLCSIQGKRFRRLYREECDAATIAIRFQSRPYNSMTQTQALNSLTLTEWNT